MTRLVVAGPPVRRSCMGCAYCMCFHFMTSFTSMMFRDSDRFFRLIQPCWTHASSSWCTATSTTGQCLPTSADVNMATSSCATAWVGQSPNASELQAALLLVGSRVQTTGVFVEGSLVSQFRGVDCITQCKARIVSSIHSCLDDRYNFVKPCHEHSLCFIEWWRLYNETL